MHSAAHDSSNQGLFNTKIQAASNAALVLYDFCVELDFPVMVCSHTTGSGNTVVIDSMAAFQKSGKHDISDRYRIAGAIAGGGNRDGTALNYALSELKMRQEDIKLLFIISDGLPSDYGDGEDGVLHLQEVIDDARRSGVFVFAAALDEDIPSIRHIYGDGMFEMTDLVKMPKTLLSVMRRFLK
jgi:nitric oxide reductase activation protein